MKYVRKPRRGVDVTISYGATEVLLPSEHREGTDGPPESAAVG
jgi:hypothetical protein